MNKIGQQNIQIFITEGHMQQSTQSKPNTTSKQYHTQVKKADANYDSKNTVFYINGANDRTHDRRYRVNEGRYYTNESRKEQQLNDVAKHPFNFQDTENLIKSLKYQLMNIETLVENSKKSIEGFDYSEMKERRQKDNKRFMYDIKISGSPNKKVHEFNISRDDYCHDTTSINFNISYSMELQDNNGQQIRGNKEFMTNSKQRGRVNKQQQGYILDQNCGKKQEEKEKEVQSPIKKIQFSEQKQEQNGRKQAQISIKQQTSSKKKEMQKHLLFNRKESQQKQNYKNRPNLSINTQQEIISQLRNSRDLSPPNVQDFMLTQQEISSLNNTCTKNQLQNILEISARRKQKNKPTSANVKKWGQSKNICSPTYSPNKKGIQSPTILKGNNIRKSISPKIGTSISPKMRASISPKSRSSFKNERDSQMKTPKANNTSLNVNTSSNGKRAQYIEKYMKKEQNTFDKSQKNKQIKKKGIQLSSPSPLKNKPTTPKRKTPTVNYSHPSKSPQNKEKQKNKISCILNKKQQNPMTKKSNNNYSSNLSPVLKNSHRGQQWNRQSFIEQMSQQCYVKRFLKNEQLSSIYDSLYHERVPKYLWEERVIQKIFNKIRQSEEII